MSDLTKPASEETLRNSAAYITCCKDKDSGSNIYKIQGGEKVVLFDAGNIPDDFAADVDILVVNNCSPDRMPYINRIMRINPEITVAATAVTLNFTEEFLGGKIKKHIIRHREKIDIGGSEIDLIPIPNVKRSRHQDRTWKKAYKFLQMPNWQWIDSICIIVDDMERNRTLLSGQLFSCSIGASREDFFKDKLRPFARQVSKSIELLKAERVNMIMPEQGERLDFELGLAEYEQYLSETLTFTDNNPSKKSDKLIVIPYVSNFGYTKQLSEAIAAGALQVPHIRTELVDLKNTDIMEAVEKIEQADSIVIGTPTIENDAAREVLRLLTETSVARLENKLATAFGSYSYYEKGVTNTLCRLEQLGMLTTEEGFSIKFKPDDNDLKSAYQYGTYFAKCTASEEILPRQDSKVRITQNENAVCTNRRFIIIGNGAAGIAAAEELRKLDTGCSIELISRENFRTYNRQMLTKCMLNEVPEKNMFLYGQEWYENKNICTILGKSVTAIDTKHKQITLDGMQTKSYDKLIIATGADPVRIDVPGKELEGIFCIHDLSEMENTRRYISENDIKNAAIIGGGIMGLETAADLIDSGIHITIVDNMSHLMSKHLDATAGKMVAERLESKGIEVKTSEIICGFEGHRQVNAVILQDESRLDAQLVIQCLGIRENSQLLEAAETNNIREMFEAGHISSGIAVDDMMKTGIPDIYACGDCTVHNGVNYGLWTQAVTQARVAARNAIRENSEMPGITTSDFERYHSIIPAVTFNGFGMSFFAVGDNGTESISQYQSKEIFDPSQGVYKKLYFKNRKLCGGILFGDVDMTTDLIEAYQKGTQFEMMHI